MLNKTKEQQLAEYKEKQLDQFDPFNNPPKLILIQGPKGSGKTTLIKSLIKHYTGQTFDPQGPVTIRVSQKQRLTLVECQNEISSIADLCKFPDIILTLIDTSLGFEMQTFEALTAMQIHGFPRCIGVATHLDFYKKPQQIKKVKKQLKNRFEVEVTEETRLFFVSSMMKDLYNYRDIHNLARLISVINPRKLEFKQNHPHILIDRIERNDLGETSLYGYIRGNDIKENSSFFLPGFGLLEKYQILGLPDPCPIEKYNKDSRSLKKREKMIYAPMSNVGTFLFDKEGDYVTIPQNHVIFTEQKNEQEFISQNEAVQMIREIQKGQFTIDKQLDDDEIFLLEGKKLENSDQQKKQLDQVQNKIKEVSDLAQKVNKEESIFSQKMNNKKDNIYQKIYGSYDFVNLRNKDDQVINYFDTEKYYSRELKKIDFYVEQCKKYFITGDQDSEDSEENDESDGFVNQEEEQDCQAKVEKEQTPLDFSKYCKVTVQGLPENQLEQIKRNVSIISQVQIGETNKGFLLVRFKRHRWFQGLLKSNDPIIVSSGLYKYQTIPYFCQKDTDNRLRYLKYTLKYEFCYAVIFGNYVANNTGVTFLKNIQEDGKSFRIGGTGVVIGFSKDYEIKKKLKLIGEPDKVFKKTAVIKNMFNSQMEVQKFIGAKIKTVSGIRGQIKRAVRDKQEGLFRAHFEDKILMSDLVFC